MITDILGALKKQDEKSTGRVVSISTTRNDQTIGPPRASSIYNACIRMHVIGSQNKLEYRSIVGFNRQLTFDIGHAMHSLIQNSSDRYFGKQRRGFWMCIACETITPFGKPPTEKCSNCGANIDALQYHEYELKLTEPYCISGHPDLFIEPLDAPNKIRVVELKTIAGDAFQKLAAPLVEHVYQIHTYMWSCGLKPHELSVLFDDSVGYITYISKKEISGELPMKTFTVNSELRVLKQIFIKLKMYRNAMRKNILPLPLDICSSSGFEHWRAKNCAAKQLCMERS